VFFLDDSYLEPLSQGFWPVLHILTPTLHQVWFAWIVVDYRISATYFNCRTLQSSKTYNEDRPIQYPTCNWSQLTTDLLKSLAAAGTHERLILRWDRPRSVSRRSGPTGQMTSIAWHGDNWVRTSNSFILAASNQRSVVYLVIQIGSITCNFCLNAVSHYCMCHRRVLVFECVNVAIYELMFLSVNQDIGRTKVRSLIGFWSLNVALRNTDLFAIWTDSIHLSHLRYPPPTAVYRSIIASGQNFYGNSAIARSCQTWWRKYASQCFLSLRPRGWCRFF